MGAAKKLKLYGEAKATAPKTIEQRFAKAAQLRAEIDRLMEPVQKKCAPLLVELAQLETGIKEECVERGETIKTEHGTATYTKGYERITWNTAKLIGYGAANPEVLDMCKKTEIKEHASITYAKE